VKNRFFTSFDAPLDKFDDIGHVVRERATAYGGIELDRIVGAFRTRALALRVSRLLNAESKRRKR
jgi:hypothetical protein